MNEPSPAVEDAPSGEWGFWQRLRRRKLRNYLFLDKKLQFNFALLILLVCGVNALYFTILIYFYSQESFMRLAIRIPDYALTEDVFQDNYRLYLNTIVFVGLFEMVMFPLLGLFFSHRIAGPLYAMSNKLQQIARGEVPGQVRLRRHDLLTHFATHLNAVIETLGTQRQEIELALRDISAGKTSQGTERLRKITQTEQPPVSASPRAGPPED
ncbi:MAG TPA: hypothetical protein VI895_00665 [Bdellovibrionota bacterium]|nr:hypothetical protein [Bdellovibrionota bacterium]